MEKDTSQVLKCWLCVGLNWFAPVSRQLSTIFHSDLWHHATVVNIFCWNCKTNKKQQNNYVQFYALNVPGHISSSPTEPTSSLTKRLTHSNFQLGEGGDHMPFVAYGYHEKRYERGAHRRRSLRTGFLSLRKCSSTILHNSHTHIATRHTLSPTT